VRLVRARTAPGQARPHYTSTTTPPPLHLHHYTSTTICCFAASGTLISNTTYTTTLSSFQLELYWPLRISPGLRCPEGRTTPMCRKTWLKRVVYNEESRTSTVLAMRTILPLSFQSDLKCMPIPLSLNMSSCRHCNSVPIATKRVAYLIEIAGRIGCTTTGL
jgi:hypothetical protein